MKWIVTAVVAATLSASAARSVVAAQPLSYQPKPGEIFVYSRVIDYTDSDGHHAARSELTFKVLSPGKGSLTIKSHMGHVIVRDVAISPDGRWVFTDKNVPASNIAWYDPAFLGDLPKNVAAGQTWQAQAAKTEMFVGGAQSVKLTSLGAEDATITTEGSGSPVHGQTMDPDTHTVHETFQQKRWTTTSVFHNGIETSFVRRERGVIRVANVQSDDSFDVRLVLTSHTGG